MEKTQLFLLHFAGGNCYSYQFLTKNLPSNIEVHALELPGRGNRMSESCLSSAEQAANDYYEQIVKLRNSEPYVIYGHSMGAILGLYVTAKMEKMNDAPLKLIVTGNAGPTAGYETQRYLLPQNEFKQELRELGGVSEEVLEHDELFSFLEPMIRADFQVLEGAELPKTCISTDIHAIMGDIEEHSSKLGEWTHHTDGTFSSERMKGGHFFIHHHTSEIINRIEQCYDSVLVH